MAAVVVGGRGRTAAGMGLRWIAINPGSPDFKFNSMLNSKAAASAADPSGRGSWLEKNLHRIQMDMNGSTWILTALGMFCRISRAGWLAGW